VVEWTDHGDRTVAAADEEGHASVPTVIYVGTTGQEYTVDAVDGESVMATAVKNGVPGIIGECGGNASCATCHVWVRDEFVPLVGEPNDTEEDLLEMGVSDRREGSRLSCQIKMSDELDGLTVDIAPQEI
jgi:ferredoxin, 2Fe-2S